MYTIRSIRNEVSQKTGQIYYKVLCDDDYVSKNHMAGIPYKEVICSDKVLTKLCGGVINADSISGLIGKNIRVFYNEWGYTSGIVVEEAPASA